MRQALIENGRLGDATLVCALAYAGLRPEEARALLWTDITRRSILVERAAAGCIIKATKTGLSAASDFWRRLPMT
jgi:hypothetical protein